MNIKAMLISLLAVVLTTPAFAGGVWTNVTVTEIVPCTSAEGCGTNGYLQALFSANDTGGASCGSSNKAWGVVDVTTTIGAYIAAVLQSARLTSQTITVYGIGSCGLQSNEETIGEVVE